MKITSKEAQFMIDVVAEWFRKTEKSNPRYVRNENCCLLCIRGEDPPRPHVWIAKKEFYTDEFRIWDFNEGAPEPGEKSIFEDFCQINRKLISPLRLLTPPVEENTK